ncbi:OPT oligopeptide transporter protein-domain-containing protein, partial [Suillus occidentalis]
FRFAAHSSSDGSVEKIDFEKAALAIGALPLADFDDPDINKDEAITGVLEDDSPYPEVRSAVANADDMSIPVSTFRAWSMVLLFPLSLSQHTGMLAQLLSFPMGRLWAAVVPNVTIFGVHLNPGPFTIKEHVLLTTMATVGGQSAYALIDFSLGSIVRRFLVIPPSMTGIGHLGSISRERFFVYVFSASCAWYFFLGYLFQALSWFTWVCWIAPAYVVVDQLFAYESGLGMSSIAFDWAQITYVVNPLATPRRSEANILAGFVFFLWILTPILFYTNAWYSKFLPIASRISYDNTGAPYNVTAILGTDGALNATAYEAYSPLFLSTTFAVSYGLSFASITATITHAFLFFRKQIWAQSRRSIDEQSDIHARLMARYRQVPGWWYLIISRSGASFLHF